MIVRMQRHLLSTGVPRTTEWNQETVKCKLNMKKAGQCLQAGLPRTEARRHLKGVTPPARSASKAPFAGHSRRFPARADKTADASVRHTERRPEADKQPARTQHGKHAPATPTHTRSFHKHKSTGQRMSFKGVSPSAKANPSASGVCPD